MRKFIVALAIAGIAAIAVLGGWLFANDHQTSQALTPITVGFDMDTAGNTCPHNGNDCTVDTTPEACKEVPSSGGTITIDVYLKGLPHLATQPDDGGLTAIQYHISEKHDLAVGTVAGYTHTDNTFNLLEQQPTGGAPNHQEFSEAVGTAIPCWDAQYAELGDVEYNPNYTQGVLTRLEINIPASATDRVYGLIIDDQGSASPLILGDAASNDYCDPSSTNYQGCDIKDALDGYGLIAKGVDCPVGSDLAKDSLGIGNFDMDGNGSFETPYTPGMEIDTSQSVPFQLNERLVNLGPNPLVDAWSVTTCTPPVGGSCSVHCEGGEVITINDEVVDDDCPVDYVWVADYPDTLDKHVNVELPYANYEVTLVTPPGGGYPMPISNLVQDQFGNVWHITSWEDNGDGVLSHSDQIDMTCVEPMGAPPCIAGEVKWFHVEEVHPSPGAWEFLVLTEKIDLQEVWDAHCDGPCDHTWAFHNEVYSKSQYEPDPVEANNSLDVDLDLACIAYADVRDVSYTAAYAPNMLLIIGGKVNIDGVDYITGADDGMYGSVANPYGGVPIIDGGVDLNADGTVDTNDDGTLSVYDVYDGGIDVNGDTTVNGYDNGVLGHPVILNAPYMVFNSSGVASGPIVMKKTVVNDGGYGPVTVDVTDGGAIVAYTGGSGMGVERTGYPGIPTNYGACNDGVDNDGDGNIDLADSDCNPGNACTLAPPGIVHNNESLSVGVPKTLTDNYSLTCGRGGIGQDDDGDKYKDEDVVDGTDNDGDGLVDEDSPWYVVTVAFSNGVGLPEEGHVVDPDPTNNVLAEPTLVSVAVVRPLTPSFSYYATSTNVSAQTKPQYDPAPGPNYLCFASEDFGCKTEGVTEIPAGLSCAASWPGCQPLAGIATILGDAPGEFIWTPSPLMTLTAKVGMIDFSVYGDPFGLPDCTQLIQSIPAMPLENDCLPSSDYTNPLGLDYMPDDRCTEDYPNYLYALIAQYHELAPSVPGFAAVSWSSALDSEVALVQNMICPSIAPYGCPLVGRYGGWAPGANIPANVLLFDLSGDWQTGCPPAMEPTGACGVGPWLSWGVTGNPAVASLPNTCTPYMTDSTFLGIAVEKILYNAGDPAHPTLTPLADPEMIKYCAEVADPSDPHIVTGLFIREDTGEVSKLYAGVACALPDVSVKLTKDEHVGSSVYPDASDVVHVSIPTTRVVTFVTTGPPDVTVTASLIGPKICHPQWVDDPAPSIVGSNQYSQITFVAGAGTTTKSYKVHCEVAGTYVMQIIANATSESIPSDSNPNNNQAQNHPDVHAVLDWDGDTIPTPTDNCPEVQNPDQTDTDHDGLGNACDDDDDGDGVKDVSDACPLLAEDLDGLRGTEVAAGVYDGCPDTDMSVAVQKTTPVKVYVSENTTFPVTLTITNGNYAANAQVNLVLKSDVINPLDKCEARWNTQAGDGYVEQVIDNVLYSMIERVETGIAAGGTRNVVRTYTVHCNAKSTHVMLPGDPFGFEASAVPMPPVKEENIGDNVHKQDITINAWAKADVKKSSFAVIDPPSSVVVGVATPITVRAVIHNNGPYGPVDISDEMLAACPTDCEIAPSSVTWPSITGVGVSPDITLTGNFTITCSQPSQHTCNFSDQVTILTTHVEDPNLANNSATASMTFDAIASGVVQITRQEFVTPPEEIAVSETVTLTLEKDISSTVPFPVHVPFTKTASFEPREGQGSDECTITPLEESDQVMVPAAVGETPGKVTVVEHFQIHCDSPSWHDFEVKNELGQLKEPHIVDTGGTDVVVTPLTVGVNLVMTKEVVDIDMGPDPLFVVPSTVNDLAVTDTDDSSRAVNIEKTAVLDQIAGPVHCNVAEDGHPLVTNTATQVKQESEPAGISQETLNWDLHMLEAEHVGMPTWCEMKYDVSKLPKDEHVAFAEPAEGSATLLVCGDTDEDTVPDNCPGYTPDNCPLVPNLDQADTDEDGLGDACDPTPSHDLEIKYCLKFGPAPANLSDAAGTYMWVICEIWNTDQWVNPAEISLSVSGAPAGCDLLEGGPQLVLPGQTKFLMQPGEQKWVLYRERFECHDAVPDIYSLDVEFCVEPTPPIPFDDDDDGKIDEDGFDGQISGDTGLEMVTSVDDDGDSIVDEDPPEGGGPPVCHEQEKLLIVHQMP